MELRFTIETPHKADSAIIDLYLKIYDKKQEIVAYAISDDLKLIEGLGKIDTDNSWDYHNNYDDSKDVLFFKTVDKNFNTNKWHEKRWSPNKQKAIDVLVEQHKLYAKFLEKEILNKKTYLENLLNNK